MTDEELYQEVRRIGREMAPGDADEANRAQALVKEIQDQNLRITASWALEAVDRKMDVPEGGDA